MEWSNVRLVFDTCIIASAARSRYGASRALISNLDNGRYTQLLSQPLLLEYEEVLRRPEQMKVHQLSATHVDQFLNTLARKATEVTFHWRTRPPNFVTLATSMSSKQL